MIKNLVFYIICFFSFQTYSQTIVVSGKVVDTLNRAVEATILVQNTNKKYFTNESGEFSFKLEKNEEYTLKLSALNYYNKKINITTENGNLYLGEITMILKESNIVIVESEKLGNNIEKIKIPDLGIIPSMSGNFEDFIKVSGLGVSSSNELTSNYNVRGGNYDENLIYVNGIEIYRPFLGRSGQQEGLSFINSAFVDNIFFSAGGFDAFYGDKLSSVLDIKYREATNYRSSIQLSTMGVQAHTEGVFGKANRGNYITGIRYRNNGYLLNSLPAEGDYNPIFFDYQLSTNYYTVYNNENNYQKLYFLGHFSNNNYRFIPTSRTTEWGTVNEAYQFRVFYEGQEETKFQTFTGAIGYQFKVNAKTDLHFVASSFYSIESENFDILGEYWINQLETDPSKDEFGDSTANVGVGGFLEHARNDLNVWISNVYHYGKHELKTKKNSEKNTFSFGDIRWGIKYQYETFNDVLSEWRIIDSAGYIIPQGNGDQLELTEVIKSTNIVYSSRVTSHFQYSYNFVKRKDIVVDLKRKIKDENDSTYYIYRKDTIFDSPSKISFTIGERTGYRPYNNEFWFTPRGSITYTPRKYLLNEDSTINRRNIKYRFSSGLYYQPPLYRTMRGIFGELNPNIVSQKSWHNVIGADIYFTMWGRPFKFVAEAYYKHMWDVVPYQIDNVRIRYFAENNAVAYAYGVDAKINGEFIKGVESFFRIGFLQTKEDLLDDFYVEYFNSDGEKIIPGYTFNNIAVDSNRIEPGYIPRPSEQMLTFSIFFQDKMPKSDNFKVSLNTVFGTPLPYGPPTFERYKDVLRTKTYFRVDLGFMYDFINFENKTKFENHKTWKNFNRVSLILNIFNLMGVKNVISYQWLQDINAIYYAIPNHLTGRRFDLKLIIEF